MIIPRSTDDWQLYYGRSYFKIKEKDQWRWVFSQMFEPNDANSFVLHYHRDDGKRYRTLLNTQQINFDLSYPECHYYFLDGEAWLLTRRAVRGSVKTLSPDNAMWTRPLSDVIPINFKMGTGNRGWIDRLEKNLTDFPFDTAMQMTSKGKALSVPIKQEWAMSLSPLEKYSHLLWYRSAPAAYVRNENELVIADALFQQEVIDNFSQEKKVIRHANPIQ